MKLNLPNEFSVRAETEEQSREVQEILAAYWKKCFKNISPLGKKLYHQSKNEKVHFSFEEFKQLIETNKNTNMKILPDKFYVRTPTAELWNLVQAKLFELGFSWCNGKKLTGFPGIYKQESCISVNNYDNDDRLGYSPAKFYNEEGIEEVQIADLFLTETPKKEIVIDILPWKVVIRGEKCDIGCRKDIKVSDLVTFVDDIASDYATGSYAFNGIKINVGRNYVYVESYNIPWEKIEKFKGELKKLKIIA